MAQEILVGKNAISFLTAIAVRIAVSKFAVIDGWSPNCTRYHKHGPSGGDNPLRVGSFFRNIPKVFRVFTANGATPFFSLSALEKRLVFRATIEPDSQEVFC